jgi:amino acid adenylation domain-containing protein
MVEDILGLDQVGINENFFDLGGHSLLATQLVSRIRMDFKVDFPLRKLFDHPLIFEIAREIENLKEVFPEFIQSDLVKIPRNNDLPLSFSQQRLWFIDQLDPGTSAFNIPTTVRLKGNLDIESLKKSLSFLSERHEILRTVFPSKDGKPIQKIIPEPNYEFAFHDLEKETASAKENLALEWLQKEGKRSFDLVSGPLIRLSIARISTTEHILLLTLHHIITDGWSMNVLVKELAEIYTSYINGTEPKLEELPVQYADYAFWQRNWFSGRIYEEQIAYWKEQLAGIPQLLEIPTDKPRPAVKTSNGSHRSFNFSLEKTRFIKEFCRKEGLTLYMFLLGVFSVLLYRYSGQDDVCVGTAVANRTRPEIEELIGFFVNNLVLRTDLSGDPSFRELATRIREMTLNAYAHQDLPFEILVDELQPQRNMSYTPLFQVGFDVQSPKLGDLKFAGLSVLPVQIESGQAPYDLLLSLTDTSEGIIGQFEYNTDLFNPDTIDRMILNLTRLLDEAIRDPDTPVSYLPILSEQERKKILYEWNATAQDTDFNHCIQERFEYWVKKQPDHPALYFEGKTYSYLEVNKKANQLARFLRKVGIGPEKIVGILAERSFETILGIMAVLKAGGAYLPLDPNYPLDRIQYMMQDASQSQQESSIFLLTQGKMIERFSLDRSRVFVFDEDWEKVAGLDDKDLPLLGKPDNLAYVIYTSGSTGKPKGTLLIHRGLCNLSEVQKQIFEISPHSKVLQFSPLSFDASVWETFMALGNGATLYLARQEILSSGLDLLRFIKDEKITTVTLPPSLLAVLPYEDLLFLKTIIAAGEACSKEIVEKWSGGRLFFNAYGPTETTVCASVARCDKDDPLSPSIGRPLPNFQLYIVDKNLKPTPVGVPGELLIGGVGVARGYLNQQQLTAEKFIFNPFSPGGRLYRTGDLVRYRTDGNVEFLGRIDQQVKVRGFRIELGEIENVIRQVPEVGDAIVIVREDKQGDRRLAGYLVPKSGFSEADIRIQDIKDSLRQKLPDYMVPAYLIVLPSFPITPSGKIDRKSLPQPDIQTFDLQTVFVAPRTSVEASLCQLCEELLSVENVGINHNFFEMGGHSLLATQFTSRIRDKFGVELPLRILFEHPTIAELAVEIEKLSQSSRDASISTMKVVSREARKMKRNDLESKD